MLKDLPVGDLTLKVSFIGYKKVTKKVTTKANTLLEVNFLLEEKALAILPVRADLRRARRKSVRKRQECGSRGALE